mgnify:CR=1 FL=1
MVRRIIFVLAALTLLGGCNMVVTPTPMFDAGDAAPPDLRNGLWLAESADCEVDTRKPLRRWPDCAEWMIYRDGELSFPDGGKTPADDSRVTALLASGTPRIWQLTITDPDGMQVNFYAGLEPVELDARGRIIRYRYWPALCGPSQATPTDREEALSDLVTKAPFPGLTMEGGGCLPADEAALRNAVAASRSFVDPLDEARWIREAAR